MGEEGPKHQRHSCDSRLRFALVSPSLTGRLVLGISSLRLLFDVP